MTNKYSEIFNAVREIYNKPDGKIALHEPVFIGNEKKYVNDAINSTYVSSVGRFVDQFERDISKYTKVKKAVAVVNGTAALQTSLRIVGVNSGDEVITQSLTFVATANAISYLDAKPIFIDVDLDTMGMSPSSLKKFLNINCEIRDDGTYNKLSNKRISACMPMHTYGFICRIDEIIKICNKWKIPVVEDAAEALGSFYKGKSSGSFGNVSALSFNGNKIITTGGGGMILTNDNVLGARAKFLTTTARESHPWSYKHSEIGYNFRMPNINASIGCAQLENLNKFISIKSKLYLEYKKRFSKRGIELVEIPKNTKWNYWLFSIKMENKIDRDLFLKESHENGILTRPIWTLMHKLPMYSNCQYDDQTNSMFLEDRVINLISSVKF
jgi:perosamine synthetase